MGLTHRPINESLDDDEEDEQMLPRRAAPPAASRQASRRTQIGVCGALLLLLGLLTSGQFREWNDASRLNVVSWNVAAINNNPFEYWITHDDADYNKLMRDVEVFVSAPGDRDVPVSAVFTPAMWSELKQRMAALGWPGLDEVEQRWNDDFSKRQIISGFLKDKELGEKRLMSMPDRVTNTIHKADGTLANRPTVINCFAGDMTSTARWWKAWKEFMFERPLPLPGDRSLLPVNMLSKIKRAKYPAVTPAEENISLPLQTLAQAIFDAVLVS